MSFSYTVDQGDGLLIKLLKRKYPDASRRAIEMVKDKAMLSPEALKRAYTYTQLQHKNTTFDLPKVRVQNAISASALAYLQDCFKDRVNIIATTSDIFSSHPVMKVGRQCIFEVQKQLLAGYESKRVIIYGEDILWVKAKMKEFNVVAVSSPILSARDDATRNLSVRGLKKKENVAMENKKFRYAVQKMEDFSEEMADILITRDVYDASIEDRATAMDRTGAVLHSYALIVPPDYFLRKAEAKDLTKPKKIGETGVSYWFSDEKNPKSVHFDMGDATWIYSHTCETYESLIHATFITTPHNYYSNSLVAKCGVYQIYHTKRVRIPVKPPKYFCETRGQIDAVNVEVFRYKSGDRSMISNYERGNFVQIPKDDFNRMVIALMSDTKKDTKVFQNAIRTFNGIRRSSYIISSADRKSYPINTEDVPMLITSIIIYAMKLRNITKERTEDTTKIILLRRELETGGCFSIFNVAKACRDLVTSIRIAYTSVLQFLKHSEFLKEVLDVLSLRVFYEMLGSKALVDFTPIIEEKPIFDVKLTQDHVRYYRKAYVKIPGLLPLSEHTDFTELFPDYGHRDVTGDIDVIEEVKKINVDEEDRSEFKDGYDDYAKSSIEELKQVLISEVDDQVHACEVTRNLLLATEKNQLETRVKETWSEASNDQQEVHLVKVDNNTVTSIYPSGTERVDSMYLVPMETLKYSFDASTECRSLKLGDHLNRPDGFYFTHNGLRIFTAPKILSAIKKHEDKLLRPITKHKLVLNEAVAGHGKTYRLVNEFYKGGALVLCNGRTNRDEIYDDLKKKHPSIEEKAVRTIDSYLMKPDFSSFLLIVDEVFMIPYGKLGLARSYARPTVGNFDEINIGDRPQIPFINRSRIHCNFQTWNDRSMQFYDDVFFGSDSKRISLLQAYHAARFYKDKIYTTSEVMRGMAMMRIYSVDDVPLMHDCLYLTYTQKNKTELLKYAKSRGFSLSVSTIDEEKTKLRTVHESQGMTSKAVIIVRLDTSNQTLWDQESHALVALTRATHATLFCCVTLQKPDMMHKIFLEKVDPSNLMEMAYKDPDKVTLHVESGCGCGGSTHELVAICDKYRMLNDTGQVREGICV